jgi:hypothetical protein
MSTTKASINVLCLFLLYITAGCNSPGAKHPQSELVNQPSSTSMTEKSIDMLRLSMDKSLPKLNKASSLIYTIGDGSLYVEKYDGTNGEQLYIERFNNDLGKWNRKYYFKNDSLVLVAENLVQNLEEGRVFKDTKTYLRNFVVFKRASRTATSEAAIGTQPYQNISKQAEAFQADYRDSIAKLNDALLQRNKFEMVFDNVSVYPDASFVVLKSKGDNGYSAALQLAAKDPFIDSLINYPATFKGEKLNLKWKISNEQAVYVPEGSTSTSANGLNR